METKQFIESQPSTLLMIQTRNDQNTWVGVEVILRILFNKINLCLYSFVAPRTKDIAYRDSLITTIIHGGLQNNNIEICRNVKYV